MNKLAKILDLVFIPTSIMRFVYNHENNLLSEVESEDKQIRPGNVRSRTLPYGLATVLEIGRFYAYYELGMCFV